MSHPPKTLEGGRLWPLIHVGRDLPALGADLASSQVHAIAEGKHELYISPELFRELQLMLARQKVSQ